MARGLAALAPCVHCGFCLPACPTYAVTGDEADGPRGRIVLMQAITAGQLPAGDPNAAWHLDRCLGCRACEPVCPAGVRYGAGLEATRARQAEARGLPALARLALFVMATAPLRTVLLGLARLARPLARLLARRSFLAGMLAGSRPWSPPAPPAPQPPPALAPAQLFLGCVQRDLFGHVHTATREVLAAHRYAAAAPPGQGCCGALHAHAGRRDDARRLARANVRAFGATPGPVVVNSAGCGAMLAEYGHLLADDPLAADARQVAARVRDVTMVLAEAGVRRGGRLSLRVAYDAPCHLLHAQGVVEPPLAVLRAIPGLTLVPHAGAERCCGSAGLFSLTEPAMSRAVLADKVAALGAVDVDVVVTGNPGCQMQIAAGLRAAGRAVPVCHPVELLAASYRAMAIDSAS